jgi:hypothetical protein
MEYSRRGLRIPDGLDFSELALEVGADGTLWFAPPALGKLCQHNGLDPQNVLANEDHCAWLIAGWYSMHRMAHGAPDRAAEKVARRALGRPYVVKR